MTFDDGPHPEITPWLLDFALQEDIQFTFFWLGKNSEKYPELVKRAVNEGHTVANHGMEHLNAYSVNHTDYLQNVAKGQANAPHSFFRPPYGRLSWRKARSIAENTKIVMWTWLSYDWLPDQYPKKILNRLKKDVRSGKILVFHESEKTKHKIKQILPEAIAHIKSIGLEIKALK